MSWPDLSLIVQTITALVLGVAISYFCMLVWLGVRASRRHGARLDAQATTSYDDPTLPAPGLTDSDAADPSALDRYHVYYVVPCLNEAKVIGATTSFLIDAVGDGELIVVDDASDDDTSAVVREATGGRATIVRRELPDARCGKGPALNAGFVELLRLVHDRGQDPTRVIVCVMDADGRLSRGALSVVLPLFDDTTVGGAQLAVRIRNRDNWVTKFQNFQFWALAATTQFGRIATGTVSLGGNGQFTRLSALLEIGPQPWLPSLTEDLDLSVSLVARGWRCVTTPHASVDQQGVETFRRLLNQRTRWYQGHMMAGRRIPELWRSPAIGPRAALESILYLLVPWLLDLPWSILYHVAIVHLGYQIAASGFEAGPNTALSVALFYLVAFFPALITMVLIRRRDPAVGWGQTVILGHSFLVMNYLSWACSWRALYRMLRGQNGWVKTDRTIEEGNPSQRAEAVA